MRQGWGAQSKKAAEKSHAKNKGRQDVDSLHPMNEVIDGWVKVDWFGRRK